MDNQDVIVTSKKCSFRFIYVIASVVILLVLAAISYYLYLSKPINTYKKLINTAYEKFEEGLEKYDDFNIFEKSLTYDYDISIDSNIDELNEYLDESYHISMNTDLQDKYLDANVKLVNKNNEAGIKVALNDDTVYLQSKELYKDIIKASIGDEFDWDLLNDLNLSKDNIEIVIKTIKNELIKSLNKDYFTKEKDNITINDKEVKVNKISYEIDDEVYAEMMDQITDNLKDNDEFIDALKELTSASKNDIIDILNSMTEDIEFDDKLEINVYTKGITKKIVQVEFEFADAKLTYKNYKDEDILINISENGKDYFTFTAVKNGKGYDAEITCEDYEVKMDIKEYKEDFIDMEFNVYYNDEEVISGSIKNDISNNSSNELTGELELSVDIEGNEVNATIKYSVNVDDFDKMTTKATDYEALTDSDVEEIINNYTEISDDFKFTKLMKDIFKADVINNTQVIDNSEQVTFN